ncbi:MAG TPA: M48 family metalloprotease, partial [Polyangiaceae bacterium]|nr:M48 family metalloprotease [Polyangiaceae bacterium]
VTTELIAALSEKTVVFVLAHELSHYYRSHMSEAKLARYEFWYDNEPDRKKRPVPSSDAAELKAAYLELVGNPAPLQSAVAGAFSPRLRPFLLKGLAPVLIARTESDFACAKARDALGPWVTEILEGVGFPSERTTDYLAFEKALADCASGLVLGADPDSTELSVGEVVLAAMQHAPTGKGVTFYNQEPLSEFLGALDDNARKLDAREAKLRADLQSNRIGLYTTEQEADELGFELSLGVGLTAEEVLNGWLEFSDAVDATVPEYYRAEYNKQNGLDTSTCRTALAGSFTTTNAQGVTEPMFVPIGQLEEDHHGNCYRLFNMWRLQQARQIVPAEAPSEMQPPWAEIQGLAKQSGAPR